MPYHATHQINGNRLLHPGLNLDFRSFCALVSEHIRANHWLGGDDQPLGRVVWSTMLVLNPQAHLDLWNAIRSSPGAGGMGLFEGWEDALLAAFPEVIQP